MRWTGNYGIELTMTRDDAASVSQPGRDAADDVSALRRKRAIARQLSRIDADTLRRELREYGAWDATELADHDANLDRLVWIAGCDIREGAPTVG